MKYLAFIIFILLLCIEHEPTAPLWKVYAHVVAVLISIGAIIALTNKGEKL